MATVQEITEDGEDEDDDEMEEEPVKPAPKSAQKQNEGSS